MTFAFKQTPVFNSTDWHMSIDLETASVENNAAIVQIGATLWKLGKEYSFFNRYISLQSCEEVGLHISKETMEWWNKQEHSLRKRVFGGTDSIQQALLDLYGWADLITGDTKSINLWGNGADFDCVILKNAYEVFGDYPFNFRKHQHLRTLLALTPEYTQLAAHDSFVHDFPSAQAHDALADSTYQAYKINHGLFHILFT